MIGWIILLVVLFIIGSATHYYAPDIAWFYGFLWVLCGGFIIGMIILLTPLLMSSLFPPTEVVTILETDEIYTITAPFGYLTVGGGWLIGISGSEDYIVKYHYNGELKTAQHRASYSSTHLIVGGNASYRVTHDLYCVPHFHCMAVFADYYITVPDLPETNITKQLW